MKNLIATLMILTGAALAQQTIDVNHAAATVAHLHDEMLNPPTFVLDAVYITKADKRGNISVCYEYRSQNVSGGMSAGRAAEDGADHLKLSTYTVDRTDDVLGYNQGWGAPCRAKNFDKDITKDVAAAAPALYTKVK